MRIKWIDEYKGSLVLIICLHHIISWNVQKMPCNFTIDIIIDFIMTFAVLGFFFISGFLFKDVKYPTLWSYIKSKTRTLLIPYLVNPSYLMNILSYPRLHILGTGVSASAESVFEWFCGDIICTVVGISSRSSMPLWFVYMLFFVSIAFYWVNKTIKNNVLLFIVGCVLFVMSWFFNIYHVKIMHCGAFIISLSMFIFGYLFNKYIFEKLLDNKKYKKILQKVLFITFLCGFVYT